MPNWAAQQCIQRTASLAALASPPLMPAVGQPQKETDIKTKKKIIMIEAFSTPRNRIVTLILLVICGVLAITAASIGIDDNPPGILLAFLAANAFILAFVHPWRTARKFMFFLLASVIGSILFVILNIILDTVAQNPTTSSAIQNLIQSPTTNAINVIIIMLCPAALVVGIVGSVILYIRSRRQQKTNT